MDGREARQMHHRAEGKLELVRVADVVSDVDFILRRLGGSLVRIDGLPPDAPASVPSISPAVNISVRPIAIRRVIARLPASVL